MEENRAEAELLDGAQSLHLRRVDEGDEQRMQRDVPVYRIVEHLHSRTGSASHITHTLYLSSDTFMCSHKLNY